jgi:hypothetical protein
MIQLCRGTPAASGREGNLEILYSLYLLKRYDVEIEDDRFVSLQVSYVCLTPLGADFIKKCDRDVEKTLSTWANTASW